MSSSLPYQRTSWVQVGLSLSFAMLLNWLPWHGVGLALRPDLVALLLLYWSIYSPHRVNVGVAWGVGLLADVADASLLGQHAWAYALMAFGGNVLHRRVQMLNLLQQAMQIFPLLLSSYLLFALVHWLVNESFSWLYFIGCALTALLWIPLSVLLQNMGRPPANQDPL